ncbi:YggT family protein [Clostridium saccharobutylicum]|uniref:YGGT family protein n=1 Tax=Clostridium saccharobutylicum TaxID=169679 RepID=A0A1S8MYG9_CLOSA|nr:YggT family protein [Clostridium saccharobutylicum]OOM09227.1 YGGT family protein [Clostridium saccharobutylicum]
MGIGIIVRILDVLFNLLDFAILIECISSWIPQVNNKFIDLIHSFTYPILEPCRNLQNKFIPGLPVDFSPIIALFIINAIRRLIIGSIF